jgi:hypothetical protein
MKKLSTTSATDIVLTGDVFDLPHITLDELHTFYEGIAILTAAGKTVYIIGGNHENLNTKLTTFDKIPHLGFTYIKSGKIFSSAYCDVHCVEHLGIHKIPDLVLDTKKTNVLLSHFRSGVGMIKEETNVQAISEKFDCVIASDIHYNYQPYPNIYYTSTPYGIHYTPKTFYGFIELSINKGDVSVDYVAVDLPSKYKITAKPSTVGALVKQVVKENDYVRVHVEGTPDELSELPELTSKFVSYNKVATEVDDSVLAGMVDDLSTAGTFDVFDTVKVLVKATIVAGDATYMLELGEEQIDEIRREIG